MLMGIPLTIFAALLTVITKALGIVEKIPPKRSTTNWGASSKIQTALIFSSICFLVLWGAAVTARMIRHRTTTSIRGAIAYGLTLLAVLLWGEYRLLTTPVAGESVRVAGITPAAALKRELAEAMEAATSPTDDAGVYEIAARYNEDLLERSAREARAGSRLIVWSETAARVTNTSEHDFLRRAQQLAREHEVLLVMGVGVWNPDARPAFENKLVAIRPDGSIAWEFHKARPIAGAESALIEGGPNTIAMLDTKHGRIGAAICHDLDFPGLLRAAGRSRADILLGPSSDWSAIATMHSRMAMMRAVENGFSLFRPAENGLSVASDPLGRVLASFPDTGDGDGILVAQLPVAGTKTVYPVIGDVFSYASVLLAMGLGVVALRRPGRQPAVEER